MTNEYKQPIDPKQKEKFVTALRAALDGFRTHAEQGNPGLKNQFDAATLQSLEFLRKSLKEMPDEGTAMLGAAEALVSFINETQMPKMKAENTERWKFKS
ncbi:MAG: hypothetical protein WCA89_14710 [Terracidiphilus sp.]|jgi:hypothetical protein